MNSFVQELYKLPDNLKYANHDECHEVIDQTHWLEGLAEVEAKVPEKKSYDEAGLNATSQHLNSANRDKPEM